MTTVEDDILEVGTRVRSRPIGGWPAFEGEVRDIRDGGGYYHVRSDSDGLLWCRTRFELTRLTPKEGQGHGKGRLLGL